LCNAACKRWACPECSRKNARKLAQRIANARANRFITLTRRADPNESPIEALDAMRDAWRKLWKRFKREFGPKMRGYVVVVELQKNGTPHLHIAAACPYVRKERLSAAWKELTGSPIVDIRMVRTERGVARYLAKYLTKESGHVQGRRRWSQSRTFLPPYSPPSPDSRLVDAKWRFLQASTEEWAMVLLENRYTPIGDGFWLSPFLPAPDP
jgi:hypothetical protein